MIYLFNSHFCPQSLCQEDAGCNWFNWNSLSNRCFMETKKGRPKDLPGTNITTGSKYCKIIHLGFFANMFMDFPRLRYFFLL